MKLSFDQYADLLIPWDFSLDYAGKNYPTRPLTIGDVLALEQLDKGAEDQFSAQRLVDLVESFFASEKPPVRSWDLEMVLIFTRELAAYFRERTKKNKEVLAPAKTAAVPA